jgi:hypothetical protein
MGMVFVFGRVRSVVNECERRWVCTCIVNSFPYVPNVHKAPPKAMKLSST